MGEEASLAYPAIAALDMARSGGDGEWSCLKKVSACYQLNTIRLHWTTTNQLVRRESQQTLGLGWGEDIVEHHDPRVVVVDLNLLWSQCGLGGV